MCGECSGSMEGFDPTPDASDPRAEWQAGTDTFDRVRDVALGLTAPTGATRVADLADCSANAARKHLRRLADMGIVRTDGGDPPRYERNDAYLEWQEADELATEFTVDELVTRTAELEERRDRFRERFDTDDPSSVDATAGPDHEAVHERMAAVGEWRAVEQAIGLHDLARRIRENDGRLVPV